MHTHPAAYLPIGLIYRASSTGAMSSFKAAFGTSGEFNFGSYKADFDIPQDGEVRRPCNLSPRRAAAA